ncbi:MAG: hypothetical protein AAB363_06170 [Planctomycetota bacterium]
MKASTRFERAVRWVFIVAAAGVAPAFVMRCDKAALNVQRGFFQGLGLSVSDALVDGGLINLEGLAVQP